jgi:hypothetical protein
MRFICKLLFGLRPLGVSSVVADRRCHAIDPSTTIRADAVQAVTLVMRAMIIGKLDLRDRSRVLRREIASGLALAVPAGSFEYCFGKLFSSTYALAS